MAGKGALFLRLKDDCVANRKITVVATHLQSDSYPSIRTKQLDLIRHQLSQILTPTQLSAEPILLLGDLNINGTSANASEWKHDFNNPTNPILGSFYSLGPAVKSQITVLEDTWARELPPGAASTFPDPADVGQTSSGGSDPSKYSGPGDGSRLDYVQNS